MTGWGSDRWGQWGWVVAALLLTAGCPDPEPPKPGEASGPRMVVEHYQAALEAQDQAALLACFIPPRDQLMKATIRVAAARTRLLNTITAKLGPELAATLELERLAGSSPMEARVVAIDDVRIDPEQKSGVAYVRVRQGEEEQAVTLHLLRTGQHWHLSPAEEDQALDDAGRRRLKGWTRGLHKGADLLEETTQKVERGELDVEGIRKKVEQAYFILRTLKGS